MTGSRSLSGLQAPPGSQNLQGHYAGFISRLMAMALDTVLVSVSFIALTWFVSVTATMLQLRTFLGFSINAIPGSAAFIDFLFGPIAAGILTALYVFGYHAIFAVLTGQTPGKAVMGLRVLALGGHRLSPFQVVIRTVGYMVAAIPLLAGYLWILVDDRRQGWHDKLAGTVVVYTWAARHDEQFLADEIRELAHPAKRSLFRP